MAPRTRAQATRSEALIDATASPPDTGPTAKVKRPSTGSKWRPYPWNLIPDWVCVFISFVILLSGGPLQATLIIAGEIVWHACLYLHAKTPVGAIVDGIGAVIMVIARFFGSFMLRDKRDASYLPWMLFLCIWAPSLYAWAIYRTYHFGFEWWFVPVYHFLRIGPRFRFFARLHVLVHKEGHDHKGFFRGPFRILNYWVCQFFIGPFYGQVPNSYGIGHNKIHHRFDNGLDDVHTNLDLDRTKFWSFLVYIPRFAAYWHGITPFMFFAGWITPKFRCMKLLVKLTNGMLVYYAFLGSAFYFDWKFALAYAVFPHIESFIFFGGISYLWHSFVEIDDPFNQYVNSITVLRGKDNIWNEDYHVVHHTEPLCHWSDYATHYEKRVAEYAANQATIFDDCEEGELLGWLFAKDWETMTKHFVDLNGKLSHEEKRALILRRLSAVVTQEMVDEAREVGLKKAKRLIYE